MMFAVADSPETNLYQWRVHTSQQELQTSSRHRTRFQTASDHRTYHRPELPPSATAGSWHHLHCLGVATTSTAEYEHVSTQYSIDFS